MKILNYQNWSIAARALTIALLPLTLITVIALGYVAYCFEKDVSVELDETGNMLAGILASAAEYGVTSGNALHLQQTVDALQRRDRNVAAVEILNEDGQVLVQAGRLEYGGVRSYEAPIIRVPVPFETLDEFPNPDGRGRTIGTVRVQMTARGMVEKQSSRAKFALGTISVVLVLSCWLGVTLARSLTNALEGVTNALRRIRGGHYDLRFPVRAGGEIGELQSTTEEMAESFSKYSVRMENDIQMRTASLEKSNAEKARLIGQVHSAVEEERKSMAIEIHDHLNANLIVIRLELTRIMNVCTRAGVSDVTTRVLASAESVNAEVVKLYDTARGIVKRLRPEIIDTLGLRDALQEMVSNYDTLAPQCKFTFRASGDFANLDVNLAMTAYRLVQEALSNVLKHSKASTVTVTVQNDASISAVRISIADDGVGFDAGSVSVGIGLIGMRERAKAANGRADFVSSPGAGTQVEFTLPIAA